MAPTFTAKLNTFRVLFSNARQKAFTTPQLCKSPKTHNPAHVSYLVLLHQLQASFIVCYLLAPPTARPMPSHKRLICNPAGVAAQFVTFFVELRSSATKKSPNIAAKLVRTSPSFCPSRNPPLQGCRPPDLCASRNSNTCHNPKRKGLCFS
jgi:hypothetical protein